MNNFLTLFKHELKMQFPIKPQKGKRIDVLGTLLFTLMIVLISAVFIKLLSTVASNYALVKINKVSDLPARTCELINLCYIIVILALVIASLENMRRSLTEKKYKELFLRMPVKHETIFLSKLLTLLISNYVLGLLLIVAVSLIFYLSVPLTPIFWLMTFAVWLLMPMAAFFIATLLLVPYIKLVDFLSHKYLVTFISVSAALMGGFLLYSSFLRVVQDLLKTGSIKFLFNEKFINTLQALLKWCYPANCFANIITQRKLLPSFAIAILVAAVGVCSVYLVSKKLFYSTLYKNENKVEKGKVKVQKAKLSPLLSLIKKEFISIYRSPKNLFSYFAIAASMPLMVYCCYTLFHSLIKSMIGLEADLPLAITIVLIFNILTNTFCSSNVTRDGAAAMKVKTYPVKASTILLSKVLLCIAVSSLSVTVTLAVLAAATTLTVLEALAVFPIAIAFSTAQIFIATRMDLNGARLSSSLSEMKSASNRTLAKVVFTGLILALITGILSFVAYVLSLGSNIAAIANLGLKPIHAYLLSAIISLGYLGAAILYYTLGIEKSLDSLTL